MKHPLDFAPKDITRLDAPSTNSSRTDALRAGAELLAEALPVGVLVRHQRGKVALINAAARKSLRVEQIDAAAMSLTIIRRGVDSNPAKNVYLLSADQEPLVRLVAEPIRVDLGEPDPLELLILDAEEDSDPTPRRRIGTAPNPRASRRPRQAVLGVSFAPRDLLACAARRLRRHGRDRLAIRIGVTPTRRGDRKVAIDEIAFAEILLSAAEWMTSGLDSATLVASAQPQGHRLRISIDGPPHEQPSDPESDRDWMRTVRPFLDAHRATFEIHDDDHHRRIVISLPLGR